MRYLQDGTHLYEVVADRTIKYGWKTVRYGVLRDCMTEQVATFEGTALAALTDVVPLSEAAMLQGAA
jgi:hypothetical protein